jgi:hypothetical protein
MDVAAVLISLPGLTVSRPWMSDHGVLYLELGDLRKTRLRVPRRDGSRDTTKGEFTLFAGYSWRLDGPRSIYGSNRSSPQNREKLVARMLGGRVVSVKTIGAVPELEVTLSQGLTLRTFNADIGQPYWTISLNKRPPIHLHVKGGRLKVVRGDV